MRRAIFVLALLSATVTTAATYPLVICLGDGITTGAYEPAYPQQLAARMPNAIVLNAGGTGTDGQRTTLGELRLIRMLHAMPDQHPIVLVMFGSYDALLNDPQVGVPALSISIYAQSLARIVTLVQTAGGTPVLMTPTPMGPNYVNANVGEYGVYGVNYMLDQFAEQVRIVAASTGAQLLDTNLICKNTAGWMDALPNGITPTSAGATLISDSAYDAIKTIPLRSGGGGVKGDANGDGAVTVTDVFVLINYLFAGGPLP